VATRLGELPQKYYARNKLATRAEALAAMRDFLNPAGADS